MLRFIKGRLPYVAQSSRSLHQRRAVDGDFVAELADFDVADDEDGFVFAYFGFVGDKQRTVIYVSRRGVAGQEFEVRVAVAAAVDVDAFAVGEVEVYFDHAAFFVFAGDVGFEGADIGGVFGADDAEQVAVRDPGFEQEETERTEISSSVCSCSIRRRWMVWPRGGKLRPYGRVGAPCG